MTDSSRIHISERPALAVPGWPVVLVLLLAFGVTVWGLVAAVTSDPASDVLAIVWSVALLAEILIATGLTIVQPNVARVVLLFGAYQGTLRRQGLWWTVPLTEKPKVSVRVRNFETSRLKVNDSAGNPIEIAAVVVWQVSDTGEAQFSVDDYEQFVSIQSETALRHVAGTHPYDSEDPDTLTLRGSAAEVSESLTRELADRVTMAGVTVLESRITLLAYAPEIAGAMLQRQQAAAIVAARGRIVDGAVGMAQHALARIEAQGVADLTDRDKAQIVANLLVVLASERGATPVLPTGTAPMA